LAASAFLLIVGVTGSIIEWAPEVGRTPRAQITASGQVLPLSELVAKVQQADGGRLQGINLSGLPTDPYSFVMRDRDAKNPRAVRVLHVNQYTGEVLSTRTPDNVQESLGSRFMGSMTSLHRNLWAGKPGSMIVNYATLIGIFLILTGAILWWPRKIWWITKGAPWRRINFDLHSVVGIYSMVFFFIIAITGSMIHWGQIGQTFIKLARQQMPKFAPAQSKLTPGAHTLPVDEVLRLSNTLPGDYTSNISVPARPTDSIQIIRRRTGGGGPVICALDQYTGAALMVNDPLTRPWAVRLVQNARPIHEGTLFGMTGRIIATISSTAIPVMVVTGFIIWWKRKMIEWRRRWHERTGRPLSEKELQDEREEDELDGVPPTAEPVTGD